MTVREPVDIVYQFTTNFGTYTGQEEGLTGIIDANISAFKGHIRKAVANTDNIVAQQIKALRYYQKRALSDKRTIFLLCIIKALKY